MEPAVGVEPDDLWFTIPHSLTGYEGSSRFKSSKIVVIDDHPWHKTQAPYDRAAAR
jgi:hypothetical protein